MKVKKTLMGLKGRVRQLSVCSVALFLWNCPSLLFAAQADNLIPLTKTSLGKSVQGKQWNQKAPVDIKSEQLSVDFEAHKIIFQGDVKVTQADFSLKAREVVATFGSNADDIERIVAKGDVFIQKADQKAWGQEAVYDRRLATILLRGNPSLSQGKNFLKGEEIRLLLNEDRMEVKGAVKAGFRLSEKVIDSDVVKGKQ